MEIPKLLRNYSKKACYFWPEIDEIALSKVTQLATVITRYLKIASFKNWYSIKEKKNVIKSRIYAGHFMMYFGKKNRIIKGL